eukprot:m.86775 g.86775  ORF g.86775 m.86775 type:complete len:139 (-) comp15108_c0_seq2:1015-1431(-)
MGGSNNMTPEMYLQLPSDGLPVLDNSVVEQLRAAEIPGLYSRVVQLVNEKVPRMMELRGAPADPLPKDSVEPFAKLAHGLKSSMSMVGAARFSLLCGKIEYYCSERYLDVAKAVSLFDSHFLPMLQEALIATQAAYPE